MSQAAPDSQHEGLKACAACKTWQPESSYSGAQLKKQGKRVCKTCVTKANPPPIPQPPPLSIAAADRITAEEIRNTLPRLIAQVVGLGVNAVAPSELHSSAFTAACEIYPPSREFAWWDATDANATAYAEHRICLFTSTLRFLVEWASAAYNMRAMLDAMQETIATPPQMGSAIFYSPAVYRGRSIFEDESRLIHKMLVHWIYFVRHFPSTCKTEGQRVYEDISQQHYGHSTRTRVGEKEAAVPVLSVAHRCCCRRGCVYVTCLSLVTRPPCLERNSRADIGAEFCVLLPSHGRFLRADVPAQFPR